MWSVLTIGEWGLYLNTVLVKSLRVPCVCQIRDKKKIETDFLALTTTVDW